MENKIRDIELLAPARNAEIAIEAIKHGADAVYMGASSHGARSAAGNSIEDISRVVGYAHLFGAKVYVTVNTIVYNNELEQVRILVHDLYRVGVDALIVQDMALMELDLPPIALHASTQCDIRTPQKAVMLEAAGFSQLVLARELSLQETRDIYDAVSVPLEAFVHGALCVSYSGDCQAGWAMQKRSANRGECPQICRFSYDLIGGDGKLLVKDKHLLSLKDLNRSAMLSRMLEAGVSSFKIEGRLKDASYVKNVTAHYRALLDRIIEANPDKYRRASYGRSQVRFRPDPELSFNRGFTTYFTVPVGRRESMASIDTPKWCGVPVGTVIGTKGNIITARLEAELNNGDGLGYFDAKGQFCGVRINRVDNNRLFAATQVQIPGGTVLYRNRDKRRDDAMNGDTATRIIDVQFTLRALSWGVALEALDCSGARAEISTALELQPASKPQAGVREGTLRKVGGTHYNVTEVHDLAGNIFVPLSALASLRRAVLDRLDAARIATHKYDYRHTPDISRLTENMSGIVLSRHDNVANRLAKSFYQRHGAEVGAQAIEIQSDNAELVQVMETRYCLRRELGHCLRCAEGKEWKEPLRLKSNGAVLKIQFDCARCGMKLFLESTGRMKK